MICNAHIAHVYKLAEDACEGDAPPPARQVDTADPPLMCSGRHNNLSCTGLSVAQTHAHWHKTLQYIYKRQY